MSGDPAIAIQRAERMHEALLRTISEQRERDRRRRAARQAVVATREGRA